MKLFLLNILVLFFSISRVADCLGNYKILRDPIFEQVNLNPDTIRVKSREGKLYLSKMLLNFTAQN